MMFLNNKIETNSRQKYIFFVSITQVDKYMSKSFQERLRFNIKRPV